MRDIDRALADAAGSGQDAARPVPAAQIRRVGARMRRIRAATAATLSAAAVAGVIGIVSTTTSTEAIPDVADTTTPSESPTTPTESPSEPTPSLTTPSSTPPTTTPPPPPPPTELPLEPILAGNLLGVDDMSVPESTSWTWVEQPGPVPRCTPAATGGIETQTVRLEVLENVEYVVFQGAEAYATSVQAGDRLQELRDSVGRCAEGSEEVDLFAAFTLTGVGDAGFVVETHEPDEGLLELPPGGSPDISLYATTRFAQTGRVVTWTVRTVGKNEYLSYPEVGDLGIAVDRLCVPAGGTCTGTAGLTITYPTDLAGTEVEPGGFSDLI